MVDNLAGVAKPAQKEKRDMWYVLQTMTGQEEKLVQMVKKIIPASLYTECFVIYYERIWRKGPGGIVHVERMFPGYVFIISKLPEELFFALKQVPAMTKLMSDGNFQFLPVEKEEEAFFRSLLTADKTIKLSYVETDGKGHVYQITGPLEACAGQVVRYQFKKRYVIVRMRLLGVEKTAVLGIMLKEDSLLTKEPENKGMKNHG